MTTAADGTTFLGTGNDGKVFKIAPDGTGTLFFDSAELEVHALAPAPDGGALRRDLARRPHLSRGQPRAAHDVLRSRRHLHLGARRRREGRGLRRHRRQGHGVSHHAGRQGRAVLQHQGHPRDHARHRGVGRAGGRHRQPGAASSASTEPNKGFLLLDTPFQEIRAIRRDDKGVLYVAALERQGRVGREQRHRRGAARHRRRRRRPRSRPTSCRLRSSTCPCPGRPRPARAAASRADGLGRHLPHPARWLCTTCSGSRRTIRRTT